MSKSIGGTDGSSVAAAKAAAATAETEALFDGKITYVCKGFLIVENDTYIPRPLLPPSAPAVEMGGRVRGRRVEGSAKDKNRWRAVSIISIETPRLPAASTFKTSSPSRPSQQPPPLQAQSQRPRQGPPQAQGAPQVRCTARVVKVVVKEGDTYGFFQIKESCIHAVAAALGRAAIDNHHYFNVKWLPPVGGAYNLPVGHGDTLSCLLGRDQRPPPGREAETAFRPKQLKLDKCEKLSDEQTNNFLAFISNTAASSKEGALLALSTCSAVWRYILAQRGLSSEAGLGVRRVLETLHSIFPSHALEEKKRDLYRSVSDSAFVAKDGPLTLFLRARAVDHTKRLEIVAVAIEEMVCVVPEAARPLYDLLTEFYSGDFKLLLSLIQRLWPSSVRVEQLLWNELPLVMSSRELLGEIDPLQLMPAVVPSGRYGSPAEYYDTYYRLMRYDGFGQLRNGIQALLSGKLDKRDMNVYKNIAVQGLRFGHGVGAGMAIALAYKPLAGRSQKMDEIMYGNLVRLSLDGSFQDPLWAMVEACDVDPHGGAEVFISLCTQDNAHDDLAALLLLLRCTTTLMVESPTYFRAVEPVLRALKQHDMGLMPFEEELVYGRRGPPPAYINFDESVVDAQFLFPMLGKTAVSDLLRHLSFERLCEVAGDVQEVNLRTTFDKSQRVAIHAALTQRIAVIQGPPGTGKSTVGRVLAVLLLSMNTRPPGPILVITY